jgi:exopolysaccharide biosynthesis polyprenyl glycosylphosphotransferase
MRRVTHRNTFLLLLGDVVAFICGLLLALALRHGQWPSAGVFLEHLGPFLVLMALWVLVFFIAGLYDTYVALMRGRVPDLVLKAQAVNMLLAVMFFFLFPVGITPKTILGLYVIASTALLVFWRLFIFPRISSSTVARAVIVGSGEEAKELSRILNENPQFGCVCVATIDIRAYQNAAALEAKLAELVSAHHADSIIADMSDEYTKRLAPLYYNLAFANADASFMRLHELYEQVFRRVPLSLIGKMWFLDNVQTDGPRYGYEFVKRLGDIIGALALLVPCVIVFPLVILAIKLQDGGKAFYRSERIGQYGTPIWIYKFRSMTGMDSGATVNTTHTVTALGRILRKLRVDELPQLWNILKGDISFVGPRPETPARARVYAECVPYYTMRHLIKPGLTGWAQINDFEVPRGAIDIPRTINKLSFDLYYLKRHSLLLDLEIVLKTIKTMLLRSGS